MKALILTSTSLRHLYFAKTIAKHFQTSVALTELKKNYYLKCREEHAEIRQHFKDIAASEKEWFVRANINDIAEIREVTNINSHKLVAWAAQEAFDVLCLFGTSILNQIWLEAFPNRIVNLHLGLSPFYRGSATLFWPFVEKDLEHLGTTIHIATEKVDAGAIIRRVYPDLKTSDSYYDITNRLIRDSIDQFPTAVFSYLSGVVKPHAQEDKNGRVYRKADFSLEALRNALNYIGDGLSQEEINRIKLLR
jgi:folate-dependent phosphoribosylglycinamide formyltransferase PurN